MAAIGKHSMLVCALWLSAGSALATDVNVIGLTSGKAVVVIDGGRPRTLAVGQTSPEGVKLISASSGGAVMEIDGKQKNLTLGQSISVAAPTGRSNVVLSANEHGHFVTTGTVNGQSTRMIVDTGASAVAMSAGEARRLGINYTGGERGYTSTANGVVPSYRVTFNSVRVGDLSLNQVEGMVVEGAGLPVTLLGMSFLKRVEMKREGTTLTLIKAY